MTRFRNLLTGQVQPISEETRLHRLVEQSPLYERVKETTRGTGGNSGRRNGARKNTHNLGDGSGPESA